MRTLTRASSIARKIEGDMNLLAGMPADRSDKRAEGGRDGVGEGRDARRQGELPCAQREREDQCGDERDRIRSPAWSGWPIEYDEEQEPPGNEEQDIRDHRRQG